MVFVYRCNGALCTAKERVPLMVINEEFCRAIFEKESSMGVRS